MGGGHLLVVTGWHYGDMKTALNIKSLNTETSTPADVTFIGIRKGGHGWCALRGNAGAKVIDFNTPFRAGPDRTINVPAVTGFVTSNYLGLTNNKKNFILTCRDDGAVAADRIVHVDMRGNKIAQFAVSDGVSKKLRSVVFLEELLYAVCEPITAGIYEVHVYTVRGVFVRSFQLTLNVVYGGITTDGHDLILTAGASAATFARTEKWSVRGAAVDLTLIASSAASNYRSGVTFNGRYLIQKQF